ncbi:MAG TPA: ATP synthase F1 subunit epsilon [Bryobacteraceae bacterium]|jgi:F-type H+-transporting ATPase subunit epsilon|nr:ATP synthase F1 subunit epsilon [Bryobacteraceae bacterium]
MADTFQLEIATPERLLVQEEVSSAELPGKDGYMGVLVGHAPLLGRLGAGVLSYEQGGQRRALAVDGGFIEIFENHVSVLADYAEFASDISADAARRELQQGQQEVDRAKTQEESDAALAHAARAQARVDAASNAGH